MKNKPIEYEYFAKRLKQRLRFSGEYDGYKEFLKNNKMRYSACFKNVKEVSSGKPYRDHVFIVVNDEQIANLDEAGQGVEYEFTAVVSKYINKPKDIRQYYCMESFGLINIKKLTKVVKVKNN